MYVTGFFITKIGGSYFVLFDGKVQEGYSLKINLLSQIGALLLEFEFGLVMPGLIFNLSNQNYSLCSDLFVDFDVVSGNY